MVRIKPMRAASPVAQRRPSQNPQGQSSRHGNQFALDRSLHEAVLDLQPARAVVALASSLDFLQGTFEKIHLEGLLCQKLLQAMDFFAVS
jgi:hypothetical protein